MQDYSHPEEIVKQVPESNIYLFNQSAASGNKGLACVVVALVDNAGNILDQLPYKQPSMTAFQDNRFVAGQFNTLTATSVCQPEDDDSGCYKMFNLFSIFNNVLQNFDVKMSW